MPGNGFENEQERTSGSVPEHLKVLSLEDHAERKEFFRRCIALYQTVYNIRREIGFKRWHDAHRNDFLDGNFSARMAFAKIKSLLKKIEGRRQRNPQEFTITDAESEQLRHLYEQLDSYHDRVVADAEQKYGLEFEEVDSDTTTSAEDGTLDMSAEVTEETAGEDAGATLAEELDKVDSLQKEFPLLRTQAVEYISQHPNYDEAKAEEIVKKSLGKIDLDAPDAAAHLERIMHNIKYQYAPPEATPTEEAPVGGQASPEESTEAPAAEGGMTEEGEALLRELMAEPEETAVPEEEQTAEAATSTSEETSTETDSEEHPAVAEGQPAPLEQPLPSEERMETVRNRALEQAAAAERLSVAEPEREELGRLLQKLDWLRGEEVTDRASEANRHVLYAAVARLEKVADKIEAMVREEREHGEGFDEQFGELATLRDEMTYLDEPERTSVNQAKEKRKGWWNRDEWAAGKEEELTLPTETNSDNSHGPKPEGGEPQSEDAEMQRVASTYEANRKEWHEAAERYRRIKHAYETSLQNHYAQEADKSFFSRVFGGAQKKLGLAPELPEAIATQQEELKKARLAYAETLNSALVARGEHREENREFSLEQSESKAAFARKFIFKPREQMLQIQQEHGLAPEQNERLQKILGTLHQKRWTIRVGQVLLYGAIGGLTGGAGAALMAGGIKTTRITAAMYGGTVGAAAGAWATEGRVERTEAAERTAVEQARTQFTLQDLERLERALQDAEQTADRAKRQQKYAQIAGAVIGGGLTQGGLDWATGPDAPPTTDPGVLEAPSQPEAPMVDQPPSYGASEGSPEVLTKAPELYESAPPPPAESGVDGPVSTDDSPERTPFPPEREDNASESVGHNFVRLEDGSYSDMPKHIYGEVPEEVTQTPEAIPEIEHHIEPGDTVWDILEHYGKDELAGLSDADRNQALMAVRAEINNSPELQEAAGIRSGDADLIYADDDLSVSPLLDVLEEKVAEIKAASPAPETMTEMPPERPDLSTAPPETPLPPERPEMSAEASESTAEAPAAASTPSAETGSGSGSGSGAEAAPEAGGAEPIETESMALELRQLMGGEGYDDFYERVFGVEFAENQSGLFEFWVDNPKEYFLGTAEPDRPILYGTLYETVDGTVKLTDDMVESLDGGSKLNSVTTFVESLREVEGFEETVNQMPDHFLLSDLLTTLLEEGKLTFDADSGRFLDGASGTPLLERASGAAGGISI